MQVILYREFGTLIKSLSYITSLSLYLIHQACIQVWCSVLQCAVGCRCSALQSVVAVCCAVSLCNSYIYPVCKCVAVRCSALKCVVAECCKVSLSTSYIKPVSKCAAVCCSAQLQCFAESLSLPDTSSPYPNFQPPLTSLASQKSPCVACGKRYICMYVYVCVREREKERAREEWDI